jgi:hypothetical protein
MTPEERAAMRRAEKEAHDEVMSWKFAAWAKRKAMTPEELKAHDQQIIDAFNAHKLKEFMDK